jgi:hypothetical protein
VLLAAGVAVGFLVTRDHAKPAAKVASRPAATRTVFAPPPGVGPGQVAPPPVGRPGIVLWQRLGDPKSEFVLHGTGYRPYSSVRISFPGSNAQPVRRQVDGVGTFSYGINQNRAQFPGGLRPGSYHVLVTAPGTRAHRAGFRVVPGPPSPPPGQPPAAGQAPPPGQA